MLTLIPAYGRDYKTAKAVKADWEKGKDFIIADISNLYNGKPYSIRDMGNEQIMIRYNRLAKFTKV